jgi:D-alanyl-D-alanine carboxypeptidase
MTAILAIESNKLEEIVTIGKEIENAYGSGIYIKQEEQIKLEDLVYGLMLRSGNDAALAIAKFTGGNIENFIEMMNKKAQELGMKNTIFRNPSGLDEEDGGNISTAYDMSLLISYAIKNEQFKKIVGTKKHKVETNMNVYSWTNKNKLLFTYPNTTGGKTGYTKIAKRTLVTTATKDNLNLAVVTLNDGNDFEDHKKLFEYGFNTYQNYKILEKGKIFIPDEKNEFEYYIENDFTYPLQEEEKNTIHLKYIIEKQENTGIIEVYKEDEIIHKEPLLKKTKPKEKTTILKKIKDWFKR